MTLFTLKQICENCNVKRRAVQGYEKLGFVRAVGKNKYGHLLYDEKCRDKIIQIKHFQDIGFSLLEIKDLLILDSPQRNLIIAAQIDRVNKQIDYVYEVINIIKAENKL
ncbi:MAG: MerR family transcriptional regulator [Erysipelotrichaceae bacterium]